MSSSNLWYRSSVVVIVSLCTACHQAASVTPPAAIGKASVGGEASVKLDSGTPDARRVQQSTQVERSHMAPGSPNVGFSSKGTHETIPLKDYGKWIGEGRRRHQSKDYLGAVEAFAKALVARPNASEALVEMGWAAYLAEDLELAERSTRAALGVPNDSSLRGAALYNLGVILERVGKPNAAVQSLKESFQTQPSTAAREHLTRLDPVAADEMLAIRAVLLKFPFPTLDCPTDARRCLAPDRPADWRRMRVGISKLDPRPPYERIGLMSVERIDFGDYSLAIRTAAGWYTKQLFFEAASGSLRGSGKIESIKYQDVISGAPSEIVATYSYWQFTGDLIPGEELEKVSGRAIVICGMGANQVPACTEPIELESTTQKGGGESQTTYRLRVTLAAPDAIELTPVDGNPPDTVFAMLGRRRIIMPQAQ
ncbi:MAG TPA: tetratricopeptide repeat protein [Polyangiaceae bacterium]|nr:tetratricopeptide repeat protein [Polyangiaceae bacterium]